MAHQVLDVDQHAAAAHAAAVAHLRACAEWMDAAEEGDVAEDDLEALEPKDPKMLAPYCGCDDCVVREALHAAYAHLLALAKLEAAADCTCRSAG